MTAFGGPTPAPRRDPEEANIVVQTVQAVTGLARKVVALELHAARQDRINETLKRQISDLTAASPRAGASTRTARRANNDRWQLCEIAATLEISPGMFTHWKNQDLRRFGRCEWW